MKFSVESLSTPVQKTEETVSVESLLTLSEEIHASYQDLSETEKSLEEVQQVVTNIDMSIAAIEKYGEQAVQVLNIDGSLAELMGTEVLTNTAAIVEKLNGTKIASLEGFGDKVKEFIAKIIAFIKGLINKIRAAFAEAGEKYDTIVSLVSDAQVRNIEERVANGSLKISEERLKFVGNGKIEISDFPDLRKVSLEREFSDMSKRLFDLETKAVNETKRLSEGTTGTIAFSILDQLINMAREIMHRFRTNIDNIRSSKFVMTVSELKGFYKELESAENTIEDYCSKFQSRLDAFARTRHDALRLAEANGVSMIDVDAAYNKTSLIIKINAEIVNRFLNEVARAHGYLGGIASYITRVASITSSGQ